MFFPTLGSNPGLPNCGRIIYQLSHQGIPRILEWVAYPFSRGSSPPRNRTRVSCIAAGFFIKLILYQLDSFIKLSGKPILEWVAMPSSRESFSRPRDRTHITLHLLHWQAGSLPLEPSWKPLS